MELNEAARQAIIEAYAKRVVESMDLDTLVDFAMEAMMDRHTPNMNITYSAVPSPSRSWGWVVVNDVTGNIVEEGFLTRNEALSYIHRYFI